MYFRDRGVLVARYYRHGRFMVRQPGYPELTSTIDIRILEGFKYSPQPGFSINTNDMIDQEHGTRET